MAVSTSHRKWLETPGVKEQPHKDSQVRRLLPGTRASLALLTILTRRAGLTNIATLGTSLEWNDYPRKVTLI